MTDKELHCPACKDNPLLEEIEERDVQFFGCAACYGLFVYDEDLSHYVQSTLSSEAVDAAFKALLEKAMEKVREGKRTCPQCEEPLERMGFGEKPFIIVDRCKGGHGIWLDKPELKKVVRTVRNQAVTMGLIKAFRDHDDEDEE